MEAKFAPEAFISQIPSFITRTGLVKELSELSAINHPFLERRSAFLPPFLENREDVLKNTADELVNFKNTRYFDHLRCVFGKNFAPD